MPIYDSAAIYIESCTSLRAKITAVDAIITALYVVAATAAGTDNITEYSLDDGQTKIRTMYRGSAGVFNAITGFETLRNRYLNQLNGRMVRLVDSKNFPGRC